MGMVYHISIHAGLFISNAFLSQDAFLSASRKDVNLAFVASSVGNVLSQLIELHHSHFIRKD